MENISLTHRIVGAIVILSLAIIFVPLLLETDQINPENISTSPVPPIPAEIETIVFDLDQQSGNYKPRNSEEIKQFEQATKSAIQTSSQEVEVTAESTKVELPKKKSEVSTSENEKDLEHTWMLQLASFKERDKAIEFRDRLRKAGYTASMEESKSDSGQLWRVRVGPYIRKLDAQDALAKINKAYKLQGMLVQRR